ncbi:MAG: molybdenum cofactor guanylyltransferase [Armatimonadetes bacterium]|nr:molybdenum cofactor guanylyltransferase [Armatimonadota bacterium]
MKYINCFILGGGKSSRLKSNKLFLKWNDKTILEHLYNKLSLIFKEIYIIVDNKKKYLDLKYPLLEDDYEAKGPLGGIYTGLKLSSAFYNFFLACDMPLINLDLIKFICEETKGFDIIIPKIKNKLEPLCCIYSKMCLPYIKEQLIKNQLKIIDFFSKVKVKYIEEKKIIKFDPKLISFYNINTREDYYKAYKANEVKNNLD